MVSFLIDEDTKWWKLNTIKAFFLPLKANSILKIPLSYNLLEDELIWVGKAVPSQSKALTTLLLRLLTPVRRKKAQTGILGPNSRK